ncbi:ficolin-2-like, partial [Aplysia californica]|uniref:Ficolin-2-like n=1 Tax=Aplysia californica TaxID=6500 RepID=A0ABM0KBC5_APLCA
ILENVAAALDRNRKEGLQQSQDLLVNVTSIMEDFEASFELQLSVFKNEQEPQSCASAKGLGPRPVVRLSSGQLVVCDTVTDQGGWIVIQRRVSADVDFFRDWADYRNGFGDLSGNFWLGLEKIHQLTNQERYELRFDLKFRGKNYYSSYDNFSLSGETENYKIHISGFLGNISQDNMAYHNGAEFSTKDRDNDESSTHNCAKAHHGAWWYKNCHYVNPNGLWGPSGGLNWPSVTSLEPVSFIEMKIRPFAK